MAKRDFYEVLGVTREVTEAELKVSYRKLAMQHHPDRNPGNQEAEFRFKEVTEAYEVLKDGQKRAAYDRFGHAAFEGGGGRPGFDGAGFGSFSDIFNDIFDDLTGRRAQRGAGGRERGADLRYNMEIELEDAFRGKSATVEIPTSVTCEVCSGTGAKPGSRPRTCPTCAGHGRVRAQQGFFSIERTCPTCQGRGEVIDDPCQACSGAGRVVRERTLQVDIPAGVEDGTRIRLSGKGEAGARGGPPGDLYIFLSMRPHPFFQREGADLHCRVPVSMVTASLGGEFQVPTIDGGDSRVVVTEGTQTGKQVRLRAKGMPVLRSREVGDMYVQLFVEVPKNLTKRQRELLAEFDRESSGDTQPESAGFFARVKDFFDGLAGQ